MTSYVAHRTRLLIMTVVLTAGLALTACTPAPPPPGSGVHDPGPPVSDITEQEDFDNPETLDFEGFTDCLSRLAKQAGGTLTGRLETLFARWGRHSGPNAVLWLETDLDDDGTDEIVTALCNSRTGGLFVVSRTENGYCIDGSEVTGNSIQLHIAADITGDGLPEIVWSVWEMGAHTATTTIHLTRWAGGSLDSLDTQISMLGTEQITVQDGLIELTGGLIGSVGAGSGQRSRIDKYRYDGERFQLVFRQFEPSGFANHRLQDGIVAEAFDSVELAVIAYREAIEDDRLIGPAFLLEDEGECERFSDAVSTLARFRLARLLLEGGRREEALEVIDGASGEFGGLLDAIAQAGSSAAVCALARQWAVGNPEFIAVLNLPWGYAEPEWTADNLCGQLPVMGL